MANGDLMDLPEVVSTLGISEGELQNMVAQGRLKAVRAGRTVKFRRPEVMALKSGRSTEPTIIIPAQEVAVPEAAVVDESADTAIPGAPATGVVPIETQEISLGDEELEIVPLEDDAAATVAESVAVAEPEEVTVAEDVGAAPPARRPSRRASARSSRMSRHISQVAYAAPPISPIWAGVLIFTTVWLLFLGSVFGTILLKGYYDEERHVRIVPSYLQSFYEWFKDPE